MESKAELHYEDGNVNTHYSYMSFEWNLVFYSKFLNIAEPAALPVKVVVTDLSGTYKDPVILWGRPN